MQLQMETPNEKQRAFLLDRHRFVGFGGARGGGKSWAVRTKAKLLCLRYPGIQVMIVRRSYPELMANHIEPLRRELWGVAVYNGTEKMFRFPGGSSIRFRYCATDGDLDGYQGTEVDVLFLDEATQLSEHQFQVLQTCVRGVNDFPKRVYLTCNPGGQGHSFVKRLFIDRQFRPEEDPEDYSFIQSRVTDNAALMEKDPAYVKQLQTLPPKLRRAWLDGDWNIFQGQFFEDFVDDPAHYQDRQWTHVIDPFEIPAGWEIHRSFDWGYSRPFSVAWWAVDYDGRAYRILELYGCGQQPNEGVKWPADRIFSQVAQLEREHRWLAGKQIHGVADPSIWDGSRGLSIYETACRHGIYFSPGIHDRIPGWMQMHYRFAFDEEGYPMLYVFRGCKGFRRTIPLLQYSNLHPEDLDTTGEDHVADESRYFLMSRPIRPRRGTESPQIGEDPLELRHGK